MKVVKVGKQWELQTNAGRWVGTYRHRADAVADMKSKAYLKTRGYHHRPGVKENPSTTTWLVLGGGLAIAGVAAYFLLKPPMASATAAAAAPQLTAGLPASANLQAAQSATRLLLLNGPAEASPARVWLQTFQSSIGLNPTGQLDQTTRAMLVKADPAAASIPTPSILG